MAAPVKVGERVRAAQQFAREQAERRGEVPAVARAQGEQAAEAMHQQIRQVREGQR